jgi:hypothetical protein
MIQIMNGLSKTFKVPSKLDRAKLALQRDGCKNLQDDLKRLDFLYYLIFPYSSNQFSTFKPSTLNKSLAKNFNSATKTDELSLDIDKITEEVEIVRSQIYNKKYQASTCVL